MLLHLHDVPVALRSGSQAARSALAMALIEARAEACTMCRCTACGAAHVLATLRGCRGVYRSAVGAAPRMLVMVLAA